MSQYLLTNKDFVPAKIAARRVGYTTDYVTRLAREGKVDARKDGRKWVVDLIAILTFAQDAEEEKNRRSQTLRAERKSELLVQSVPNEFLAPSLTISSPNVRAGRFVAFVETAIILVFGFAVGSFLYYTPTNTQLEYTAASINESGLAFLEHTAISFYSFINQGSGSFAFGDIESSQNQTGGVQKHREYSVVMQEGQALSTDVMQNAFSDEVRVDFGTEIFDGGVVTPRFESGDGDAYRFKILLEELNNLSSTKAGG
ncbi:hypothetical protein COU16_00240 [Candidatus Kaiserbacteria bacterium CG10_big_fil_rev_8_21_14_0_10_47_16]|uniref:Helix-turn-helix domain-containing protein n=1 Tax=Candidatus Kaiserbacteria bacterium CG10_big_fil_rev_8_21_14_0_10_47_16 TaxID=1974608 RepID=A0A2H0UET3_9BACT|nr:MAG: hypothetical protein COU16_00240 [Candidatus Kaiserbacteria bacterium CG10_big_fil_rev_8_21_14_0_10_47_16]